MITLKINVTKLDKKRFFTGKKGIYCDLVLIDSPNNENGDFIVKQSISKEERAANVQMPILGDAKDWSKNKAKRPQQRTAPKQTSQPDNYDPEVGF